MKRFRSQIAVFLLFVALLAVTILDVTTSQGQSQTSGKPSENGIESRVKPTTLIRERRTGVSTGTESASSNLAPAAARNVVLQMELEWELGGKPQRGWHLYTPLIQHLLKSDEDVDSDGFAAALARWQAKSGLTPTGVLDEEALYKMIADWQNMRLKEREYPEPDQLITAPPLDFYHPTRPEELRQVERQAYDAYKRMVAAAVADRSLRLARSADGRLAPAEKYLKILSSFRTREYQEYLRRQSPNAGRAGLAINSPHFTGRALDLYVGGEPVDTTDSNRALQIKTRVYLWLVRNAERFGFRPYFYEPWHWEYVGN